MTPAVFGIAVRAAWDITATCLVAAFTAWLCRELG